MLLALYLLIARPHNGWELQMWKQIHDWSSTDTMQVATLAECQEREEVFRAIWAPMVRANHGRMRARCVRVYKLK